MEHIIIGFDSNGKMSYKKTLKQIRKIMKRKINLDWENSPCNWKMFYDKKEGLSIDSIPFNTILYERKLYDNNCIAPINCFAICSFCKKVCIRIAYYEKDANQEHYSKPIDVRMKFLKNIKMRDLIYTDVYDTACDSEENLNDFINGIMFKKFLNDSKTS